MPSTIIPIAPFYDEHSSAPPPCAPILTDQQELRGKAVASGLLADEALTPSHLDAPRRCLSPLAAKLPPEFKLGTATRAFSPPHVKKLIRAPSKARDASEEGSSAAESSDVESILSATSDSSKIPKPPGEPGRPRRGGYNLETALGWNQKTYSKFKKYVHDLIDEHLDTSKCSSAQSITLLNIVQDKATNKFPDLENYVRCWPVTDLIMMRLKYTSSRARKLETEMAAGKNKKSTK